MKLRTKLRAVGTSKVGNIEGLSDFGFGSRPAIERLACTNIVLQETSIQATRHKLVALPKGMLRRACLSLVCVLATLPDARAVGQTPTSSSSLSLHEAIQQAQGSPQAREGQDRVDVARGSLIQASLRPNPRLYLQSEDLRPWANHFDFPNDTEDYGYLGQLFELGGKRAKRIDVAKSGVRQADAERLLLTQQIAGRVAVAYWTAVANTEIARLLEADMKAVDEIVRYNQARVDAGAMRGVDLIRVQIERDRLLLALEAARREVVLSRIDLFRQMGRVLDSTVQLSDSLDSIRPVQTESVIVVMAARADVTVARETVAMAEAEVKLQRAIGVPDLDLLAGYKRNAADNTLYTGLQIPLAFRNRNQGEVARAQANVRLANDRLQQVELSVSAEVQAAQEAYTHQQAVVRDILPAMRARAKQNLAIMDDAYRTGGVDLLRYLDAERTAFDVEVSAVHTLADFQQAALHLQLAYGVQP